VIVVELEQYPAKIDEQDGDRHHALPRRRPECSRPGPNERLRRLGRPAAGPVNGSWSPRSAPQCLRPCRAR
jgi:hypothetical protein